MAEDDDADQRQAAADAPAPELDRVGAAALARTDGVLGPEMIARPPPHAGKRRGSEGFRIPLHALQRLAGLAGFAGLVAPDRSSVPSRP